MKWHYVHDKSIYGPVDEEKLFDLFDIGVIRESTPIREEGKDDWIPFRDSELHQAFQKVKIKPGKIKKTFIWFLVLFPLQLLAMFYEQFIFPLGLDTTSEFQYTLQAGRCVGFIPQFIGSILVFVLLHHCWTAIQNENSTLTPGKAVGLLFIPVFNFYWVYRAYWGFSKQANEYTKRIIQVNHKCGVRTSNQWLSLAYSFVMSIGAVASIVIYRLCFFATFSAVDPISVTTSAQYFSLKSGYLVFWSVQILLIYLIQLFMLIDFYKTAQSILKFEDAKSNLQTESTSE
jgi:hypothetical protein